ncbi:MAG: hypothetical protein U0793_12695 [Gemmataceae bacterium]
MNSHLKYRQEVRRLDAAFSVEGRDALARMTPGEVGALYAEKMIGLSDMSRRVHRHPHDELGQLRKAMLEAEVREISGYLEDQAAKERAFQQSRLKGKDLER